MSLTDIDKNGDQREQPQLNQKDHLLQRRAASTTSFNPVSDSSSLASLSGAYVGAFRIIKTGTTSIPSFTIGGGGANVSLVTVAHGLSAAPLVSAYCVSYMLNGTTFALIASTYTPIPNYGSDFGEPMYPNTAVSATYYSQIHVNFAVDATNLYFQAVYLGGETDTIAAIPVTYFLFQQTGSI